MTKSIIILQYSRTNKKREQILPALYQIQNFYKENSELVSPKK
jgi:hypothetical protein